MFKGLRVTWLNLNVFCTFWKSLIVILLLEILLLLFFFPQQSSFLTRTAIRVLCLNFPVFVDIAVAARNEWTSHQVCILYWYYLNDLFFIQRIPNSFNGCSALGTCHLFLSVLKESCCPACGTSDLGLTASAASELLIPHFHWSWRGYRIDFVHLFIRMWHFLHFQTNF